MNYFVEWFVHFTYYQWVAFQFICFLQSLSLTMWSNEHSPVSWLTNALWKHYHIIVFGFYNEDAIPNFWWLVDSMLSFCCCRHLTNNITAILCTNLLRISWTFASDKNPLKCLSSTLYMLVSRISKSMDIKWHNNESIMIKIFDENRLLKMVKWEWRVSCSCKTVAQQIAGKVMLSYFRLKNKEFFIDVYPFPIMTFICTVFLIIMKYQISLKFMFIVLLRHYTGCLDI